MVSMCRCSYTYAIALNNIAVCLLQQHCYAQAIVTLVDAVKLLRLESRRREQCDVTTCKGIQCNGTEELLLLYQRACRRLARPRSEPVIQNELCFEVRSGDESFKTIVEADHQPSSLSGSTFLFRIEAYRNLDLESSMVLHNYAMAYICLAAASSVIAERRKRLENSHRVLTLALELIGNQNNVVDVEALLSSSIMLRSLVSLSIDLDLARDTYQYKRQWSILLEEGQIVEKLIGQSYSVVAAAA